MKALDVVKLSTTHILIPYGIDEKIEEKLDKLGKKLGVPVNKYISIDSPFSGFFVSNKHLLDRVKTKGKQNFLGHILTFESKNNNLLSIVWKNVTIKPFMNLDLELEGNIIVLRKEPLVYKGEPLATIEVQNVRKNEKEIKNSEEVSLKEKTFRIKYPFSNTYYKLLKVEKIIKDKDKPGFVFVGGIHGDEYDSVYLCSKIRNLTEKIKANFLFIPEVNIAGMSLGERFNPMDGYDINRVFFGIPLEKKEGVNFSLTPSQEIANEILRVIREFKKKIENDVYLIDIHSSSKFYKEKPQFRLLLPDMSLESSGNSLPNNYPINKVFNFLRCANNLKMKKDINIPVLIRNLEYDVFFEMEIPGTSKSSLAYSTIKYLNIPAIIFISDVALRLHPQRVERYAEIFVNGIKRYIENPKVKDLAKLSRCILNLDSYRNSHEDINKFKKFLDKIRKHFENFYYLETIILDDNNEWISLSKPNIKSGLFIYSNVLKEKENVCLKKGDKIGKIISLNEKNSGEESELTYVSEKESTLLSIRLFPLCREREVLLRIALSLNYPKNQ